MARAAAVTGTAHKLFSGSRRQSRVSPEMGKDYPQPDMRPSDGSGSSAPARNTAIANTFRNSHLLLQRDYREHKRALMLASAFSETAKLAKRIQELEAADSELEQYREVLRAAIAFHRRRRALHNSLAAIPESEPEPC